MSSNGTSSTEDASSINPGVASNLHTFYLIKEKKATTAYSEFAHLLEKGYEGLLITRTPPNIIRQQVKNPSCKVIWLTGNKVPSQETLAPNEISRLAALLIKYLSSVENEQNTNTGPPLKRVILMDNLEYLILQNNFQMMLRILHLVRDKIMLYPAIMLIPVDPLTFDFKELRLIERECEVIDIKDY